MFLKTKSIIKAGAVLTAVIGLFAGTASAQICQDWPTLQSGNRIGGAFTVSKFPDCVTGDVAHFTTIQAAVNAVPSGSVIQIMDTSTYAEQVTIDGQGELGQWYHWLRRNAGLHLGVEPISPEPKSNITIIYIPPQGWPAEGAHTYMGGRPTIRFRDTYNNRPLVDSDINQYSCDLPSECRTVCELINGLGSSLCANTVNFGGGGTNFENNGALRMIRTSGNIIDGIRIDGGGVWTRTTNMWGAIWFFGNAAVTVSNSNSITIRNSVITGATHGIALKDRNLGGAFANINEHDLDESTPLGNFGAMGNHIIEYNRIHTNLRGIFFESGWDLGSYIRHNLIYNNNSSAGTNTVGGSEGDRNGGIYVRDHIFQPVAIHNNTFFKNDANFNGGWQIGAPHLIYNNIYGAVLSNDHHEITGLHRNRLHNSVFSAREFQVQSGQQTRLQWSSHFSDNHNRPALWPSELRITSPFDGPNSNEVSATMLDAARVACQTQSGGPQFTMPGDVAIQSMGYYSTLIAPPAPSASGSQIFPQHLAASNTFTVTTEGGTQVGPFPCRIFIEGYEGTANNPADISFPSSSRTVSQGSPLGVLPSTSNNRFLQVDGHTEAGMPILFMSTNPADRNFLVPVWTNADVRTFIMGSGWGQVNNGNLGGAFDLGAIQSPQSRMALSGFVGSNANYHAHIRPTNVVMIDTLTRQATVNFQLDVLDISQKGTRRRVRMENPRITHLRWVEPLPHRREVFPGDDTDAMSMIVGTAAHTNITPPTVTVNSNANTMFTFQVPRIPGTASTRDSVGAFLEIVVSGTVNGQQVSSNVGFLPYRLITHGIEVCVLPANSTPTTPDALLNTERMQCLTEVVAGEPYQLKIVPTRPNGAMGQVVFRENLEHVDFRLNSGGDHAFIWCHPGDQPANGLGTGTSDYNRRCPQPVGGTTQPGDFVSSFVGGRNETYMASDRNIRAGARYRVFFTHAGDEQIFVTAQTRISGTNTAFLGTTNVRVLPAAPSQITFIDPVPLWQLSASGTGPHNIGECALPGSRGPNFEPLPEGCMRAQLTVRGMPSQIITEVQDRFGNAVDVPVPVTIASDNPNVGDAGARGGMWMMNKNAITSSTWDDPDRGRALFEAHVTGGEQNQYFDLTATATFMTSTFSDIGRLRLARPLNQLRIFYDDNGTDLDFWNYYDPTVVIEGMAISGAEHRQQITVKTTTPVSVVTNPGTTWAQIVSTSGMNHEYLRFYETRDALTPSANNIFQIVDGEVTFWVGVEGNMPGDIVGACVRAAAFTDAAGINPNSDFQPDTRCGITLILPHNSISEIERDAVQVEEIVVVAPIERSSLTLTIGPNPVDRQSGAVNFYLANAEISSGALTIYDASGNVVRRLSVDGDVITWDLHDARGRLVSDGSYLARGSITLINGKRERVSVVVGVR